MGSAIARINATGDARVDGVLSRWAWAAPDIGYSDPWSSRDYADDYFTDDNRNGKSAQNEQFGWLNVDQRAALKAALDTGYLGADPALAGFAVEGFTDLRLTYNWSDKGAAEIRAANSGDPETAYAFYPDTEAIGGDIWFGPSGRRPEVGNYDYHVILHEVGHALGLSHGHETVDFGALPHDHDSLEYSLMTYRTHIGQPVATDAEHSYTYEDWGAPQSFMMLDIAALQHMYGANFEVNAGHTTYSWRPGTGTTWVNGAPALEPGGNTIFATIWDGGGTDTYDVSAYRTGVQIDLRPGGHSVLGDWQLADLGGGPNGGLARGSIFNALQFRDDPRSLIENVIGGQGSDTIHGNAANNVLKGRKGSDVLRGDAGDDKLFGGRGHDRLYGGEGDDLLVGGWGRDHLSGGPGDDIFRFVSLRDSTPGRADRLIAGDGAVAFEGAGEPGGDRIDLRPLDADPDQRGNQAFTLGDGPAQGMVWLRERKEKTFVLASADEDARVGFKLVIEQAGLIDSGFGASDFLV